MINQIVCVNNEKIHGHSCFNTYLPEEKTLFRVFLVLTATGKNCKQSPTEVVNENARAVTYERIYKHHR